MLNAGWGCSTIEREGKEMERISSKIFSGTSHSLCPGATGQGLGLGCEREQREMEWQPAWSFSWSGCKEKRERGKEKKE
jgi:hypothetical protein